MKKERAANPRRKLSPKWPARGGARHVFLSALRQRAWHTHRSCRLIAPTLCWAIDRTNAPRC